MKQESHKGFTLIELLVVIAIVAVLSVVVILTLNPAELLRQARDSNRISDMATVRSALSLYLADVLTPVLATTTAGFGYLHCYATNATGSCAFGFSSGGVTVYSTSTATSSINGAGWLPVDFTQISSGAPLGNLPVDPVNTSGGNCIYGYMATSSNMSFKVVASCMESRKYARGGSADVVSTDGGSYANVYEVGTNMNL